MAPVYNRNVIKVFCAKADDGVPANFHYCRRVYLWAGSNSAFGWKMKIGKIQLVFLQRRLWSVSYVLQWHGAGQRFAHLARLPNRI